MLPSTISRTTSPNGWKTLAALIDSSAPGALVRDQAGGAGNHLAGPQALREDGRGRSTAGRGADCGSDSTSACKPQAVLRGGFKETEFKGGAPARLAGGQDLDELLRAGLKCAFPLKLVSPVGAVLRLDPGALGWDVSA
jgi:hypothetical protein